jgi:hypothetical protein
VEKGVRNLYLYRNCQNPYPLYVKRFLTPY